MALVRSLQAVEPAILRESLPEQQCAVGELFGGRDTFINLPTGYGKSNIYQVLPVCAKEILSHAPGIARDDVFQHLVIVLFP